MGIDDAEIGEFAVRPLLPLHSDDPLLTDAVRLRRNHPRRNQRRGREFFETHCHSDRG